MPHDLGVLLVHGIGDQRRGATLVDFGTPLFDWIKARGAETGATVDISEAVIPSDGDVPAHATWVLSDGATTRTWKIAEAWWAESFAVRPYRELAQWSYSVLPWTFGAHFGRRLWRALSAPKDGTLGLVTWLGRVASALAGLLVGLATSLVLVVVFSGLLVLGLIPWQWLRDRIQRLQIRLASTIGDSFVMVNRPIETASILTRFRQHLDWLAADCNQVAVVAHSQGGAVAVKALGEQVPSKVKLLITFGSGLRKLQDLTDLKTSGSWRKGALFTALGLVGVLLGIMYFAAVLTRDDPRPVEIGGVIAVLFWVVLGLLVLGAGVVDFVRVPDPAKVRDLANWFARAGVAWQDIYASADPVPNGRVHEDPSILPTATEIINFGSSVRDHTSYWTNSDGFVARVASSLLAYDASPIHAPLSPSVLNYLAWRRARRVTVRRVIVWIGLVSFAALGVRYASDWRSVLAFMTTYALDKLAGILGGSIEVSARPTTAQWGRSLGWLSPVLILWMVTKAIWNAHDRREKTPPYVAGVKENVPLFVAISFELVLLGIAWNHGNMVSSWVFAICLFGPALALHPWIKLDAPQELPRASSHRVTEVSTGAERTSRLAAYLAQLAVLGVGCYLFVRASMGLASAALRRIAGIPNPSWLVSLGTVLVISFALLLVVGGLSTAVRRWRKRSAVALGGQDA
jgi:hypothetical protein